MGLNKIISFLLIDDDEDDRELFQIALADVEQKIEFAVAESGVAALEMLESKAVTPDYIFLDLNMPQMSGRECLQRLKENSSLAGIPVVIFSTSSDPRDVRETKESGAIDFITKPSKTSELTQLLKKFISNQSQDIN